VRTAAAIAAAPPLDSLVPGQDVCLRNAGVDDAGAIHGLIAAHLAEGHLLPRERAEIEAHVHRFVVGCQDEQIVACAELAPLSRDVSEVRSLVVTSAARSRGFGRALIDELIVRASAAGYEKLCAFTHAPSYFVHLGFSMVPHVWLQEKIVTDCHSCPHFRHCGQYAVLLELRHPGHVLAPLAALHG
jgi:N-acetylglutamate synthase-like GNAT family acetyltransferase